MHAYWRAPADAANRAAEYLAPRAEPRSRLLVEVLRSYVERDARVLEVGCNAGRNLKHLWDAGFRNLEGVEISPEAVDLLRRTYPELAATRIRVSSIEDAAPSFADNHWDVVFTMAVLEHVHTDSDWVFQHLARASRRFVVTVEDERGASVRHFPRNYRTVFEPLGLEEVESRHDLESWGLSPSFVLRVFSKPSV